MSMMEWSHSESVPQAHIVCLLWRWKAKEQKCCKNQTNTKNICQARVERKYLICTAEIVRRVSIWEHARVWTGVGEGLERYHLYKPCQRKMCKNTKIPMFLIFNSKSCGQTEKARYLPAQTKKIGAQNILKMIVLSVTFT